VGRKLFGVLVVAAIFSMIAIIPKGYSQLNLQMDYLVDDNNNLIELNITAPVYITSVPVQVLDSHGNLIMEQTFDNHFTNRINKASYNRFVSNIDMPENMPARIVLFPGTNQERAYTLIAPEIEIDLHKKEARVFLVENSKYSLTITNAEYSNKYTVLAGNSGWYTVNFKDVPDKLLAPGAPFYSTVEFPGGLSASVTRYVPRVVVDAGRGYTKVKGWGISGKPPEISIRDGSRGRIRARLNETAHIKQGEFLFQQDHDGNKKDITDGDRIVYREDGYGFEFDIPYFYATYNKTDGTITGTVTRSGQVVFKYGSQLLKAIPDNKGRFSIKIEGTPDVSKLLSIKAGYVSEAGNEYWKRFDWSHIFNASPIYNSPWIDIRVMTYNIHHALSQYGRMDIDAIADVIRNSGAQIIGLQEVDKSFFRTFFIDQAKILAEKLGMYYYFGDTISVLGAQYGNAILSSFPISNVSNLQLDSKGENRGILSAKIDVNGKELNFLVTHLSLNKNVRSKQVQQLKRYLELLEDEVIVVGDFNSVPGSGEIAYIERELIEVGKETGFDNITTFRRKDGTEVQIDYIFISPDIAAKDIFTIVSKASDHLPLLADISLKDM
jgi:endonuclease/exonuclease/phosphatase family metal-dependent hydrolase